VSLGSASGRQHAEPAARPARTRRGGGAPGEVPPAPAGLRIGDVARRVGTTPRTIRYYEEIGLLGGPDRLHGQHRLYCEPEVERLREVLRLKELLGVSLDELGELLEAVTARGVLRDEWQRGPEPERGREILTEARGHLDRQLELVRRRRSELATLEAELLTRRRRVMTRMRTLSA